MEKSTGQLIRQYFKGWKENFIAMFFTCITAGIFGFVGYLLFLGAGKNASQFTVILLKILGPVIVGILLIANVGGFLNFLKYRWQFVADREVYDSITHMGDVILLLGPVVVLVGAFYLLTRTWSIDFTFGCTICGVVSLVFSQIAIDIFQFVRREKYRNSQAKLSEPSQWPK